jgi:hypothetical protein
LLILYFQHDKFHWVSKLRESLNTLDRWAVELCNRKWNVHVDINICTCSTNNFRWFFFNFQIRLKWHWSIIMKFNSCFCSDSKLIYAKIKQMIPLRKSEWIWHTSLLTFLIQIKSDLLELFYLAFYIARYRWILWELYFYFISWMTVVNEFSVLYSKM